MLANHPVARRIVVIGALAVPISAMLAFLIVQPEISSVTLAAYAFGFILFTLGMALLFSNLRKDRVAKRK
ncbi:hypothetical protein [Oerskovia enterophila]|uniref:Uncharacterized protein n=1 Tax=Oerskovia enterophila TaxID=43678 RepID=A0A161XGX3_9CELL|nr:hypothetical protein [Oerskovia enterophila]KZM36067.1 hypothetical protein OJAG_12710 [Oerskovia enterophila]OCI32319.1 hypothetical protein OERS_09280 [Oerskovia enterophila]